MRSNQVGEGSKHQPVRRRRDRKYLLDGPKGGRPGWRVDESGESK